MECWAQGKEGDINNSEPWTAWWVGRLTNYIKFLLAKPPERHSPCCEPVVEGVPKVMHDMGSNLATHHTHAKVYAKSETNQIGQTVIPTWVLSVNALDLMGYIVKLLCDPVS
jgi:hypothetical protein